MWYHLMCDLILHLQKKKKKEKKDGVKNGPT